jgi:hypothetical protein
MDAAHAHQQLLHLTQRLVFLRARRASIQMLLQ